MHARSKLVTSVGLYCVIKLHILELSFIVASLRHTCAIIMLFNQHLDMPHLWGGWIISAKEKCSLTQIYTDLWTTFERNRPFVYIEKVLDLWVQLMKNGAKTKVLRLSFCSVYNTYQILFTYAKALQRCRSLMSTFECSPSNLWNIFSERSWI